MIWLMIILFLIGISFGCIISDVSKRTKANPDNTVGTLRIDKSDPDGPYMFLELKQDPYVIERSPTVTLDVKVQNYISQE